MDLRRDTSTSWLGGVCSGIALRVGVDPLLIRALVIILSLAGGFGVLLYLAGWLLIPDLQGRILLREAGSGSAAGITLIVVSALVAAGVLGITPFNDGPWFGGWIVPIAIALVLWLIFGRRRPANGPGAPRYGSPSAGSDVMVPHGTGSQAPAPQAAWSDTPSRYAASPGPVGEPPRPVAPLAPPKPRRRPSPAGSGIIALGLAVVAFGVGYLLDGPVGFPGSAALLGLLAALGTTSLVALILGLRGRAGGLASALTVILLLGAVPVSAAESFYTARMARPPITWAPALDDTAWNGTVGELTVDLSSPALVPARTPSGDTDGFGADSDAVPVNVELGAGHIVILVPRDLDVRIDAQVGAGQIDPGPLATDGQRREGLGVQVSLTQGDGSGTPVDVTVRLGAGEITVKEK